MPFSNFSSNHQFCREGGIPALLDIFDSSMYLKNIIYLEIYTFFNSLHLLI